MYEWKYPSLSFFEKILAEDEERAREREKRSMLLIPISTEKENAHIFLSIPRSINAPTESKRIVRGPSLMKSCNRIHWRELCMNPGVPVAFLEKHKRRINWRSLSSNRNIPLEFFIENKDQSSLSWHHICMYNCHITSKFVRENRDLISIEHLSGNKYFFRNVAKEELLTLLSEVL